MSAPSPGLRPGDTTEVLIRGRRLARNAAWNLVGLGLPLVAGLVAIPLLVAGLGTARFGVLTLAWVVSGYFSLFDLGLGRAVTKLVAERLGRDDRSEIGALAWTALSLMTLIGLAAMPLIIALSRWLVDKVLAIPIELHAESYRAFFWMAVSVPFVISTTGLRAVMEAHQQFARVNAIRVPMGIFTFVGPLAVLPFSQDLGLLCAVLTAGRAVAWLVHLQLCRGVLGGRPVLDRRLVRPLLGFGGWMTVSSVIGPVMVYLDRFFIGAVLSVTAVAYYATPFEVVTKLLIIPTALSGVLFPALSTTWAGRPGDAARLLDRGTRYLFLMLFPLVLVIVGLAREGLQLWLGAEFALNSGRVLQWLAVGVLVNGLAQLPLALVHGAGRPDLSAKVHSVELVVYLPALWWALARWGVEGAAAVWTLRAAVDAGIFFLLAARLLPAPDGQTRRRRLGLASALVVSVTLAFLAAAALSGPWTKALFLAAVLAAFAAYGWRRLLEPREREEIKRALGRAGSPPVVHP